MLSWHDEILLRNKMNEVIKNAVEQLSYFNNKYITYIVS